MIALWFITSKYDRWVLIEAWAAIRMNTVGVEVFVCSRPSQWGWGQSAPMAMKNLE